MVCPVAGRWKTIVMEGPKEIQEGHLAGRHSSDQHEEDKLKAGSKILTALPAHPNTNQIPVNLSPPSPSLAPFGPT